MSPSRREFIKRFGIALASLVSARCVRLTPTPTPLITCYTQAPPPTETPQPLQEADLTRQAEALKATAEAGGLPPNATRQAMAALARERLRACWLSLDALAERSADMENGDLLRQDLTARHRTALDDLVSIGELDEAAAVQVQLAFQEAAYHVWRSNVPLTCYDIAPGEVESRTDLVERAAALSEVSGGLDAAAVAQAQEALRRDIAFFALLQSGETRGSVLSELWTGGGFEVGEADDDAAQFLIELLLEE